jgi:UPF0716 family protein affecting phage T7 exclusion
MATCKRTKLLISPSAQGNFIKKAYLRERIVLFVAALLLIRPGVLTDLLGIGGTLFVLVAQTIRVRKDRILGNSGQIGNYA